MAILVLALRFFCFLIMIQSALSSDERIDNRRTKRTLIVIRPILVAEGQLKIAFLKFCIYKLKIMIKLVAFLYGLKLESDSKKNNNDNNDPDYEWLEREDKFIKFNDNLNFQLTENDLQARSYGLMKIFLQLVHQLYNNLIIYVKQLFIFRLQMINELTKHFFNNSFI